MATRQAGYTLVELLVVMAIIGLTIALCPPLLRHGQIHLGALQHADQLAAQLQAARDGALQSGLPAALALPNGVQVWFFPDGSATATSVSVDGWHVIVAPLTGRISVE